RAMSLVLGSRLGPYEITAKLGEGGMGEVYRATDTKLDRQVAIKVLPAEFTADAERLARFEREAKLLAQLHHPNIASIFGLEESGGALALVLELVEGPTLADRLAQGALPLAETRAVARQIAEALEEAHEKGIVHRDLKPQNVKVTADGKVKVLDFGLAKALESSPSSAPSASQLAQSPTLTFGATQMGMILGTAGYMSPEQAAGKTVDRRTDIWAFGVVLWEMLAGRRLFDGDSVPETLGAVFRQEIDFGALSAETPPALRQLVERCLERDPKARLRDIGEARIALADPRGGSLLASAPSAAAAAPPPPKESRSSVWPWALVAIAAVAIPASSWLRPRAATPAPARLVAVGISPPASHALAGSEAPILDLARDGGAVAFEAEGPHGRQLFLRRLERAEVEPLAGTGGATQPFFSPDGRTLGFFAGGRLRKLTLAGGAIADVVKVGAYRGATWTENGWIVFTPAYSAGLSKVREAGGRVEAVTTVDPAKGERTHRWPTALPGSPWIVFSVGLSNSPNVYDDARIEAVNLDTGERKTIYEGAWMARFAPPSTLLVQRRAALFALPFDPQRAERTGEERVLLDNVGGESSSGAGYFAAGAGGVLAYAPAAALVDETEVVIVEPDGRQTRLPLPVRRYWYPRFSPDGRSLALDIGSGQGGDDEIWRYDLATQGLSRVTFENGSALPAWSPDGASVAYTGGAGERINSIFRKRVDGGAGEQKIARGNDLISVADWLPDGRALIVGDLEAGELGLFRLPLDGGASQPIVAAAGDQYSGSLRPGGGWLAYTSVETGVDEIFVSTYPEGGGKWQVSTDGGQLPVWTRDGKSVLYVQGDVVWAVDVDATNGFRAAAPRELLRGPYILRTAPFRNYDAGPGGRLVFVARRTDVPASRQLEVLVGWPGLLNAPGR
ncbi:MAG: serine/threonine-protein kinase, partial [Thermoanaerobaculia bacterium]|nr:serine/threonine-protein kinase [Thermoanaerobaculia bacterium]